MPKTKDIEHSTGNLAHRHGNVTDRRGLLLSGAALAAAGPGAAALADNLAARRGPTPSPDAELIQLSQRVVAGHAEMDRYSDQYGVDKPPHIKACIYALVDECHDMSEQIGGMRATTMEGLQAKARALLAHTSKSPDGGLLWSSPDELLAWSIARDLLGRARRSGGPSRASRTEGEP